MSPVHRPAATALALLLSGSAVPALAAHPVLTQTELAVQRQKEPQRALKASTFLQAQARSLGLGSSDALQPGRSFTNVQGQTIVRFSQTHQGARVFGAEAVVAVHPDERMAVLERSLASNIRVSGNPVLSAQEARLASHRDLLPEGAYAEEPQVELLVFPTRFTGGLQPRFDAEAGVSWDRDTSVLTPPPADEYVWAYEVTSILRSLEDGARDMHVIVDARTGDVLRKWDAAPAFMPKGQRDATRTYADLERATAPLRIEPRSELSVSAPGKQLGPVEAATASDSMAAALVPELLGSGTGYYVGKVPLATSQNVAAGGYDMWDLSRAAKPHPRYATAGILTAYYDMNARKYFPYTMANGAGSKDNRWGDGFVYVAPAPTVDVDGTMYAPLAGYHYGDANGQTAAVDAHFAATTTYDMYKNVLGRLGIDGQDSGIYSIVHYRYWFTNAMWSTSEKVMVYGDGNFPFVPDGYRSFTALDVGGHEMSHGVMNATANLVYSGEPGGLNEANSDMMSQSVVSYAKRAASDPRDVIPQGSLDWTIGVGIDPTHGPLRYMYKPSLDGYSPDAWFQGISMLDVHYSSGPANRMFHFLVEGSASDATSDHYSAYLPEGMTGIGIDKATRIWFKAVTEHFTSTTNYAGAREGCVQAATDLYGAGSPELAAVENAFGAINVGPAHGKAPRPLVTFPADLVDPKSRLVVDNKASSTGDAFLRTPIVPAGEVVRLHANVEHATDPSVFWKAGIARGFLSPSSFPVDVPALNGYFDAEGQYHAPRTGALWAGVRAFSKEDPLSFGASLVFVARLDADGDSEQDAVDQGVLALTWGLTAAAINEISPYPDPEGKDKVDDYALQMWSEGFRNAFTR